MRTHVLNYDYNHDIPNHEEVRIFILRKIFELLVPAANRNLVSSNNDTSIIFQTENSQAIKQACRALFRKIKELNPHFVHTLTMVAQFNVDGNLVDEIDPPLNTIVNTQGFENAKTEAIRRNLNNAPMEL